jgi:Molybdopterin biosynthesis enzyme
MLTVEEAQQIVISNSRPLESEKVALFGALNRVTLEEHRAPWDIPPADNSAMDGYAFRHDSVQSCRLTLSGFLAAGNVRDVAVGPGEAVKIMTGAPIPSGCDCVVPQEETHLDGNDLMVLSLPQRGANIRERGEDIRLGEIVIPAGTRLRPQELGMLAAMGRTSVAVYRKARVAISLHGGRTSRTGGDSCSR